MRSVMWIVMFLAFGFPSQLTAARLEPADTNWLKRVCLNQDSNAYIVCTGYLLSMADVYFSTNVSCPRPEVLPFTDKLLQRLREVNFLLKKQPKYFAALVVLKAISEINPCPAADAIVKDKQQDCTQMLNLVSSNNFQFLDNFQKQMVLETLRNRGCLK